MKRRTAPRGYTLLEAMVVISLTSTILAAAAVMLHTLYRAQHLDRHAFDDQRTLERFANALRADARDASQVEVELVGVETGQDVAPSEQPPRRTLRVSLPEGRTVEYALGGQSIQRVERSIDGERREQFPLSRVRWTDLRVERAAARPRLVLEFRIAPGTGRGVVDRGPPRLLVATFSQVKSPRPPRVEGSAP